MPTPTTFRQILEGVGAAITAEMVRLLSTGRYPLRKNSPLIQQLLSSEAIQIQQQRSAGGQFAGYGAASLTIVALDYLKWVDEGRRPGAKKIPISALLAFIKARNIGQIRSKNGRYGNRTISANALAWAIQQAVYKAGIKGKHIISPAWELGQNLLSEALDTHALDALTEGLEQQFFFTNSANR